MYLDRAISGIELLVWIFVYVAAFATACATWGTPLFVPIAMLCLLLAVAYPLGNYLIERHGLWRMRTEDIAAYSQAYAEKPNNPYPLRRLGDIFFKSQDYELAIKYYTHYLTYVKDGKVAHRIGRAREFMRQSPSETRICPDCHALNPKSASHCIECGEPLPGLGELLEPFRGRKGISILMWTAAVAMTLALGVAALQVLTERFAPLLAYILMPFMLLVALTALMIYVYIRASA